MGVKIGKEDILKRLLTIFPNYTFDLSEYTNTHCKIKTICGDGHESYQTVKNLLKGHGCNTCGNIRSSNKQKLNFDDVLKKFKDVHFDKYDYSEFDYKKNRIDSTIICPEHGRFTQSPWTHMKGHGCPSCSGNKRLDTDMFIKRSKDIHSIDYDYSKVNYINMKIPVEIICPKHGPFHQVPATHIISGSGCPVCSQSYGERLVEIFLKSKNIKYESQKKFSKCKHKSLLSFDFYLPDYNTCIEFNGLQHYHPVDIFGGVENYKIIKLRDNIKNDFCEKNNIKLIVIKQDKKHINLEDIKNQISNISNIIHKESYKYISSFEKFKNL